MRFFVPLGQDIAAARGLARAVEELGYEGITVPDHLFVPAEIESPYPYKASGKFVYPIDAAWPDVWVTVANMAGVTERIHFRSSVYLPALRHPIIAARAIGTAAVLSGNRVELGVGVGWLEVEYDVMGVDFRRRGAVVDEEITALRTLWQPGPVRHDGEHWQFGPLYLNPTPTAPIPIIVGGNSERAMRRAATLGDGYMTAAVTRDEAIRLATRVQEIRDELGRAGEPFQIHAAATDAVGVDDYRRLVDAGIDTVIASPGGRDDPLPDRVESLRRFADDVVAKL